MLLIYLFYLYYLFIFCVVIYRTSIVITTLVYVRHSRECDRERERERQREGECERTQVWQPLKYFGSSLTAASRQETLSAAATQAGEYAQVVEKKDRQLCGAYTHTNICIYVCNNAVISTHFRHHPALTPGHH